MPTEYEVFEVNGHEIKLSNPGKVSIPQGEGMATKDHTVAAGYSIRPGARRAG